MYQVVPVVSAGQMPIVHLHLLTELHVISHCSTWTLTHCQELYAAAVHEDAECGHCTRLHCHSAHSVTRDVECTGKLYAATD